MTLYNFHVIIKNINFFYLKVSNQIIINYLNYFFDTLGITQMQPGYGTPSEIISREEQC
jgi:hypothetical protein